MKNEKFWNFCFFYIFHIFGSHRQTKRPWKLIFGIRDPLDGTFHWCQGQFPHSKKILWFCFYGAPEVQGCPENTCPKKIIFFQKFSLYIMTKHVSRWILMVSFSFWPYDQKREKCHFSVFVILTKKIANNVFCKHSHYNLQKILSILGTWISQISFKMTDFQSMWLERSQKSVNQ